MHQMEILGEHIVFYTEIPVYPFGHGLSYTTFNYSIHLSTLTISFQEIEDILQSHKFSSSDSPSLVQTTITVTNTGKRAGDDVVLAFAKPPNPGKDGNPLQFLFGFDRIHLQPGEKKTIHFELTATNLGLVDEHGERHASSGMWTIQVGEETVSFSVEK